MNKMIEIKHIADDGNRNRFDQSPQPNYPNFEPVKQGSGQKCLLGSIGWGMDKGELKQEKSICLNDSIDRAHINFWDTSKNQKFNELTGSFTKAHDKTLDINPEIYHLMNASAQRVSIKSLDMQRQST